MTARVIVLTTFDLDASAVRAIRAGASGFVLKDAQPEFLLAAIRTVHAGTAVISPAATRDLFEHFAQRDRPPSSPVAAVRSRRGDPTPAISVRRCRHPRSTGGSPRANARFFHLVASGLTNAEIARAEFLSEATVKTHVSRVLNKLELRDRVQLVLFAVTHGLLPRAPG